MSAAFYSELPPHVRFDAVTDADAYVAVPADWTVIVTDVEGSTAAVAAGRYRAVNYAGAASVAALLNAVDGADLPFVFGGDGATLLAPGLLDGVVRPVLRAVQTVVRDELGLTLRAGLVPVGELYARGARLAVLKHAASPHYAQAMFVGDGLIEAERLVKDPATAARYAVGEGARWADPERKLYAGLECRWREVRSPRGEVATLLVLARAEAAPAQLRTYRDVLEAVAAAYGAAETLHPVPTRALRLAVSPRHTALEAAVRAPGARQAAYRRTAWIQNVLGRGLIRLGLRTQETDWHAYPEHLRGATDYRKFDGMLRMVLSGSAAQRAVLQTHLDRAQAEGTLTYGLHVSDRATLTCLVFNRMGRQVHFVDGADGGYTAAASQLKARLAERRMAA